MMKFVGRYMPGLAMVTLLVLAGMLSARLVPGLGAVTATILWGMVLGNTIGVRASWKSGVRIAEKKMLNVAIALMGLELELSVAAGLGLRTVPIIVGVIGGSIFLGIVMGRLFRLPAGLALLLGIGNGICGSAAIAASAPVIDAGKDDVGISIAVVNLMGAIGIFLIPAIALLLGLEASESGLLIGGTLQAVGQTVATGLRMGDEVARLATMVKMGRVLLLGAVLILLSISYRKKSAGRFPVPPFIVAFVLLAVLVNVLPVPESVLTAAGELQDVLLLAAVAAIGLGIEIRSIARYGVAAFLLSGIIFAVNILLVLALM